MNGKKNIFISSFMLMLTALLLVISIVAWYVSNDSATVSGITGSTEGDKMIYLSSTYSAPDADKISSLEYGFDSSSLASNGFSNNVTIPSEGRLLLPVSTMNGTDYYYATVVNSDGTAGGNTDSKFTSVSSSFASYYYIESSIYILTTEEDDVTAYLSSVMINKGVDETNLYKSVRVSMSYDTTTAIVRNKDGGAAYPASGVNAVSATDPSVSSGVLDASVFSVTLPHKTESESSVTYYALKLTLHIWIEGQNSYAVSAYAGTGFTVRLGFMGI